MGSGQPGRQHTAAHLLPLPRHSSCSTCRDDRSTSSRDESGDLAPPSGTSTTGGLHVRIVSPIKEVVPATSLIAQPRTKRQRERDTQQAEFERLWKIFQAPPVKEVTEEEDEDEVISAEASDDRYAVKELPEEAENPREWEERRFVMGHLVARYPSAAAIISTQSINQKVRELTAEGAPKSSARESDVHLNLPMMVTATQAIISAELAKPSGRSPVKTHLKSPYSERALRARPVESPWLNGPAQVSTDIHAVLKPGVDAKNIIATDFSCSPSLTRSVRQSVAEAVRSLTHADWLSASVLHELGNCRDDEAFSDQQRQFFDLLHHFSHQAALAMKESLIALTYAEANIALARHDAVLAHIARSYASRVTELRALPLGQAELFPDVSTRLDDWSSQVTLETMTLLADKGNKRLCWLSYIVHIKQFNSKPSKTQNHFIIDFKGK